METKVDTVSAKRSSRSCSRRSPYRRISLDLDISLAHDLAPCLELRSYSLGELRAIERERLVTLLREKLSELRAACNFQCLRLQSCDDGLRRARRREQSRHEIGLRRGEAELRHTG